MAPLSLAEVTTPSNDRLAIPDGWRQGRGAYGGLVIASLVRAIEERVADPDRRVRTVTAELPGPVELGVADISVEVLRTGHSMTTARAQISQSGEVRAHAVAILAKSRRGAGPLAWQELSRPAIEPWTQVPISPFSTGGWPEFAQHFEFRIARGVPLEGATDPTVAAETLGWVRPKVPGPHRDAAYIAAIVDAWWPAALVRMPQMRPIATIAYTLEIVSGLDGLDPESPLLYRGTVPVCADGYFLETRELWGEDGRLVALNHQTFAVIA